MDYCTLEDAWGVKSFRTELPPPETNRLPKDPAPNGQWPVSGPYGWRSPLNGVAADKLHPVTASYMQSGVEGILMALPQQAVDELRARLMVGHLNIVGGLLLSGFVLLVLWDVLIKRR